MLAFHPRGLKLTLALDSFACPFAFSSTTTKTLTTKTSCKKKYHAFFTPSALPPTPEGTGSCLFQPLFSLKCYHFYCKGQKEAEKLQLPERRCLSNLRRAAFWNLSNCLHLSLPSPLNLFTRTFFHYLLLTSAFLPYYGVSPVSSFFRRGFLFRVELKIYELKMKHAACQCLYYNFWWL